MKTKTIEKWILLEQTGELSPRRQRILNASAEAGEKRAELAALRNALPPSDAELPPWSVAKINARLCAERHSSIGFSNAWKPALALAACLTVIVGTVNHFHGNNESSAPAVVASVATDGVDVWSVPNEDDLTKLENLIVAISDDPPDIMEM